MLVTLLLSNAIVAWHNGAHYYETHPNTDYSQYNQSSQQQTLPSSQMHTDLCDIGVFAHGVTAVAVAFQLPELPKAAFWQPLSHALNTVVRISRSNDARAPPFFSR